MQKSFVLFQEYKTHISLLSTEQKGSLFEAIFEYNDGNEIKLDPITSMAFSFIKADLEINKKKWEETREKRRQAGKAGGLKSGKSRRNEANEANASNLKQNEANEAVSVSVSVSGNVSGNVNDNINANEEKNPPTPQGEKGGLKDLKRGNDLISLLDDKSLIKAKKNAPQWDIYNLAEVYISGIKDRGMPDCIQAAFIGWCLKYTKGKPPT